MLTVKKSVSIIVPIYNSGLYLEKCIESIIDQTYRDIEIILVDDGSTDNSREICQYYAQRDNRVKLVSQTNKGVSSARNAGIEQADGEYIMFVDSDDTLIDTAVEILVKDMDIYDVDIVSAMKKRIYYNEEKDSDVFEDEKITLYKGTEGLELIIEGNRQMNSVCAKLFNKSFIKDIRFVEGRKVNEDGFFVFECLTKKPKFLQHNTYIYNYYMREDSASHQRFSDKFLDMIYFCNRKKEILEHSFPQFSSKVNQMEFRTHILFLVVLCRTMDEDYKKYERCSIEKVRELYPYINHEILNKQERKMARIIRYGFYRLFKKVLYVKKYKKDN